MCTALFEWIRGQDYIFGGKLLFSLKCRRYIKYHAIHYLTDERCMLASVYCKSVKGWHSAHQRQGWDCSSRKMCDGSRGRGHALQYSMQKCPPINLGASLDLTAMDTAVPAVIDQKLEKCACSKRRARTPSNHCQGTLEQGIEPPDAQGSVLGSPFALRHLSLSKCACMFICVFKASCVYYYSEI